MPEGVHEHTNVYSWNFNLLNLFLKNNRINNLKTRWLAYVFYLLISVLQTDSREKTSRSFRALSVLRSVLSSLWINISLVASPLNFRCMSNYFLLRVCISFILTFVAIYLFINFSGHLFSEEYCTRLSALFQ